MNFLKQFAVKAVLEAQALNKALSIAEAKYIITGMEDGWLKYNKKEYELAKKLLASI